MFSLMGDTSTGVPIAMQGCPFDVGGGPPTNPNVGNGCANTRTFSVSPSANETLFTIKFDYTPNSSNSFWYRFQLNEGQNVQMDPVNSIFDAVMKVPSRSASAGWTHVFGPNLVNQFNPGISYLPAVSSLGNPAQALAVLPFTYTL